MKTFKNISFIAAVSLTFLLTSCTGVTTPNLSESDDQIKFEAQDYQQQTDVSGQYGDGRRGDVVRVRPD